MNAYHILDANGANVALYQALTEEDAILRFNRNRDDARGARVSLGSRELPRGYSIILVRKGA